MKQLFIILALVLFTSNLLAQPPEKMSYQAVVRNSNGTLVQNSNVGIRISILQGSAIGTVVYAEAHNTTTNENGLVSLEIGVGNVVSGTFADIDWANGPLFLQNETDPNGGFNYSISGVTQLLSVPYALYAKTAGTNVPEHYIGELYGDGIIFYLYKDATGEHGLIVSLADISSSHAWSDNETLTGATSLWDGLSNSTTIQASTTNSAADLCLSYTTANYSDWYLPSYNEICLLFDQSFIINKTLGASGELTNANYWSSTDFTNTVSAVMRGFGIYSQNQGSYPKNGQFHVRAIRKF